MDPQKTLVEAAVALVAGCLEDFDELMAAYAAWRNRGGFEPDMKMCNGDEYFRVLIVRYEERYGKYTGERIQ